MLTLNDKRNERVQNVQIYVKNREDEESFVYGELYCIVFMIQDIYVWYEFYQMNTKQSTY